MAKDPIGRGPTAQRHNYSRTLAWRWLQANRPDVIELIWRETNKKFPGVGKQRWPVDLPPSLKKLK
jgi:hypothetical protein